MTHFTIGDLIKFDEDMDIVKVTKLSEAVAVITYVNTDHEYECEIRLVGLPNYQSYTNCNSVQAYLQDTRKEKYNDS